MGNANSAGGEKWRTKTLVPRSRLIESDRVGASMTPTMGSVFWSAGEEEIASGVLGVWMRKQPALGVRVTGSAFDVVTVLSAQMCSLLRRIGAEASATSVWSDSKGAHVGGAEETASDASAPRTRR